MAKARSSITVRSFSKVALLLALAAFAPALAQARTDTEIREVAQTLIMDRHPQDTPAHWLNLGPRAPAILQDMYEAERSTFHRMRLLEGLGYFTEDASAKDFVKQQAEQASNEVVRHAALRSIGQNQAKQEEEWLGGFLGHENPHTRLLAAKLLRSEGSESAQAKVSKMMSAEKTPWVLAALKGEVPQTVSLKPSGSSEDRLSSDFKGVWRGFWVEPHLSSLGMKSEAAEFKLAVDSGNRLSGALQVQSAPTARSYVLKEGVGKGLRWSGKLLLNETAPQPGAAPASLRPRPEPIPVEAELARRSGNLLLEIRAPQTGLLLILRRD